MSLSAEHASPGPGLDDSRVYAIGDVHGRPDLLRRLLKKIKADAAARPKIAQQYLVFLGDYIDRGYDSCGVVDVLLNHLPERFYPVFLKGNHEDFLLQCLLGADFQMIDLWLSNGGLATLSSYDLDPNMIKRVSGDPEHFADIMQREIPAAHQKFYRGLQLSFSLGGYFFVHAGVRPRTALADQREQDLIWIRRPFLTHEGDFGKVVVHGHSPVSAPKIRPNRIAIDTGAVFTDVLTAVRLEGTTLSFLQTAS